MLKPGTIVGNRYRCRHLLAEGGMAEVYLAERLLSNAGESELVALKRLLPSFNGNPIFADLFAYEASLSTSFSHKNLVRCVEFFRDSGDYFMALEFVLGKEVGSITHNAKSWKALERVKLAVAIGLGVCEALHYVHGQKDQYGMPCPVVHGDLSPQNIMIDIAGDVKVYDFGAAKTATSELFEEKVVRGNPRYMSPEQMAGKLIGPSSDIFSLCLLLVEIVLGETRFERSEADFIKKAKAIVGLMDLAPSVKECVHELIDGGLQYDPERRFATTEVLRACLECLEREVGLFDPRNYLEQILKTDGPNLQNKPIRRRGSLSVGYLFYLSFAATMLGLSIWVMIAVFSDLFEPKHQRNLPVWPADEITEPIIAKQITIEAPVAVAKIKKKAVLKHGTLVVKVKPWAEVFIDGQFFGSTPMGGLNLPEGHYLVQLRNPDVSAVALRMVKIYADKKTELVHNF